MRWLAFCLIGLTALLPAAAQYEDDEDLAEQDRRYFDRYAEPDQTRRTAQPDQAAAFQARADELIRDKNYGREVTRWYDVRSDDPRLKVDLAARLLEDFRGDFESFWDGRVDLLPYDRPSRVYLFYSFFKYNQLLSGDFRRSEQRPKGHYDRDLDVLTVHTDADAPGTLADTLIHEAAHQLVDQRLYGRGHAASLWVSEGLASFFGYAWRDEEGRFRTERIGGKSIALLRGQKAGSSRAPAARLREFRERARRDEGGAGAMVEAVLALRDPGLFYSEASAKRNYTISWLMVHYLLHGDEGRHAGAFAEFLELDSAGRGTPQALYAAVGKNAEEFGVALLEYARSLKSR